MPIQRAQLMPEIGRNAISSISQTRIAAAAVKDWIFLVSIAFLFFLQTSLPPLKLQKTHHFLLLQFLKL